MRQGLWGIVSGRVVKPSIMDAKALTSTELENIAAWEDKAEKAAGELYLLKGALYSTDTLQSGLSSLYYKEKVITCLQSGLSS